MDFENFVEMTVHQRLFGCAFNKPPQTSRSQPNREDGVKG
jgi:hypothetical protein